MSILIVFLVPLMVVILVMIVAGLSNAITIKRDLDQRFDRLRSGLETDATHIVQPLLRDKPAKSAPRKPRHSVLRRIK